MRDRDTRGLPTNLLTTDIAGCEASSITSSINDITYPTKYIEFSGWYRGAIVCRNILKLQFLRKEISFMRPHILVGQLKQENMYFIAAKKKLRISSENKG